MHVIPLDDAAAPTPSPSPVTPAVEGRPEPDSEPGDLVRTLLIPLVAVVALGAALSYAVSRRR